MSSYAQISAQFITLSLRISLDSKHLGLVNVSKACIAAPLTQAGKALLLIGSGLFALTSAPKAGCTQFQAVAPYP
jgi:hypothetical protein